MGRAQPATEIASSRAVFTPSIASEILNLHPRTLMIYESESLIKPQRTVTNRRRYSEEDIRRVQGDPVSHPREGREPGRGEIRASPPGSPPWQGLVLDQVDALQGLHDLSDPS